MVMSAPPQTSVDGRYRLQRQIGSGATARVWLAFDTVLERPVAVKMLEAPIGGDSDHIERFRREARAVARIQHPHIVGVLDTGEHEGVPYIVLEYVEGETLKERIQRVGRLTITEAVAFTIEVARALEAAHARGIVHRDIKPQNILLDPENGAKVADFGIARSGHEDALTVGGRVLGTTDYVAPEQALGHEVTGQSDVYSLGVVLYESLTGSVPFRADNPITVATMHVRNEIPDVQDRRPEISAGLAAVVERATSKSLAHRHATAAEMISDLEEALAIETARTGSARRGDRRAALAAAPTPANALPLRVRHPAALAGAGALALAIAGGGRGLRADADARRDAGAGERRAAAPGAGDLARPGRRVPVQPVRDDAPRTRRTSASRSTATPAPTGRPRPTSPERSASQASACTSTRRRGWRPTAPSSRPRRRGSTCRCGGRRRCRRSSTRRSRGPASARGRSAGRCSGAPRTCDRQQTILLSHVRTRRYYLLWITSLGPDPTGADKAIQIAEFTLWRRKP